MSCIVVEEGYMVVVVVCCRVVVCKIVYCRVVYIVVYMIVFYVVFVDGKWWVSMLNLWIVVCVFGGDCKKSICVFMKIRYMIFGIVWFICIWYCDVI